MILTRLALIWGAFYIAYHQIQVDRPIKGFLIGACCIILATLRLEDRFVYYIDLVDDNTETEITLRIVSIDKIQYSNGNYKNFEFVVKNFDSAYSGEGVETQFYVSNVRAETTKKICIL